MKMRPAKSSSETVGFTSKKVWACWAFPGMLIQNQALQALKMLWYAKIPWYPALERHQGCWSKSGWNRVIVEKPFGKNGEPWWNRWDLGGPSGETMDSYAMTCRCRCCSRYVLRDVHVLCADRFPWSILKSYEIIILHPWIPWMNNQRWCRHA